MKLIPKILILFLLISCNTSKSKSELDIAQEYFNSQKEFDEPNLNKLLSDSVQVFYGNKIGTDTKTSLIKLSGFSYGLNTQNELIKITKIDTNKVELIIKETDDLTKYFEMVDVIYKYTYEINSNRIQKITLDTIDNPNFNYKQQEIIFHKKLNEFMQWIHENHKDKAQFMNEYNNDYRAGKILSELIKREIKPQDNNLIELNMNKKEIYKYVDKSLLSLQKEGLMVLPHSNMPTEMIDTNVEQKSDWIPWKAISSKVTDDDIIELENQIELKYPKLYKDFLKYKHFYELENAADITFFRHCVRDWKNTLTTYYFDYWQPEELIKKGFIPFADYSDWGIVCFDTNRMHHNDCPIVMFDHETLYNKPVTFEELYDSFELMASALLNELNE